ncbi:MAG: hypothetical protein JWR19_2503 [Pedosphaera sp.]|jgi:hypothetical protein|nr:hypothetical protein [Pedosphaera sp.]
MAEKLHIHCGLATDRLFSHDCVKSMDLLKTNRTRALAALALTALVALVGFALSIIAWRPSDVFLHGSYDSLHSLIAGLLRHRPDTGPLFLYLRGARAGDRAKEFKQR